MDHEKKFKGLLHDMMELLKKHAEEWDDAERGIHENNVFIETGEEEVCSSNEPVIYPEKSKSADKSSGLLIK